MDVIGFIIFNIIMIRGQMMEEFLQVFIGAMNEKVLSIIFRHLWCIVLCVWERFPVNCK